MRKRLQESACDALKGRVTYFLTRYYDVHNSYGRAAVRLDGKEMVCFSWTSVFRQRNGDAGSDTWRAGAPMGQGLHVRRLRLFAERERNFTIWASTKRILRKRDHPDARHFGQTDRKRTLRRILDAGEYEKEPMGKTFYRLRFGRKGWNAPFRNDSLHNKINRHAAVYFYGTGVRFYRCTRSRSCAVRLPCRRRSDSRPQSCLCQRRAPAAFSRTDPVISRRARRSAFCIDEKTSRSPDLCNKP